MRPFNRVERKSFSKLKEKIEVPNLLDVQLSSYDSFLQRDVPPEKRETIGLQAVFMSIFPITDVHELFSLEFVKYSLGEPRYSIKECRERNMTFGAPLKATLRLVVREAVADSKEKSVKDIVERDVFLGEFPLLTENGTFIINGAERVIVSQLHRSPGVFFDEEIHPNGKRLYSARIIPYRGSWVEFTLDVNDIMFVHIDSRRKLAATTLLRALGYSSNEDLLKAFYKFQSESISARKGNKFIGSVSAQTIADRSSGEVIVAANQEITDEIFKRLVELKADKLDILDVDFASDAGIIRNTIEKDSTSSYQEALFKIYGLIRPGDAPTEELARDLVEKLFFNPKRYDLGEVGRYMINQRLGLDVPLEETVLNRKDFIAIIQYLINLRNGIGDVDDIDHLGNRRARSVGELLSNQFSVGLSRMARTIRERMSLKDQEQISPHDLVNARTISAVIDSFFGSSQLSQFMDQTNPLAELTHKRRLSALGPGGLTRERAGFKVRDVHHTHYGRICPIETPEGPNIGLIASLSTYAKINKYGFLETPYRRAKNGKVTDEIEFLTADQEDKYKVAQANEPLSDSGKFVNSLVKARHKGEFIVANPEDIDFMDVSPKQLVSVAAALIPFLEHDDANRALMGSNMQRQAVPLLKTETPIIGTGMEGRAAVDAGAVVVAKRAGTVEYVDAEKIVIRPIRRGKEKVMELVEFDEYELTKFRRSNQDTCINQRPIVHLGDKVEAGDPIADGPGTDRGEIALGANTLVGFLPWRGYNFEDAIIVSERLVSDDIFTSIHIEEFELQVRDTKRGPEEITREIPNVSEEALLNLDERGIVRTGAEVEAGDILVGKVTPKGETELSPEERLLRAIFGEKAGDVRDASLKAPPGMKGIVVDTKVFSRKERSEAAKKQERNETARTRKAFAKQIDYVAMMRNRNLGILLDGHTARTVKDENGEVAIKAGTKYREDSFEDIHALELIAENGFTSDDRVNGRVEELLVQARALIQKKQAQLEIELEKIIRGAELSPGVVQLVKVSIATKRALSVGDKMAGRHGNKGVVAKVVPMEDMPYMPDGTPLDIILNPLGVPSRMNVGQILETHLGWAAKLLGFHVASPVFDGANIDEIRAWLREAKLPENGKTVLYDGRTGDKFEHEITVGQMYMMKLSHLVDDKIHARSIGPYSLVTQQPLGGKAQFGGQRFGEMEVWALEAYGAAYTLQEMLTVKSDDVAGRSRIYEAIVKGDNPPEPGIPESFNVLVKELQSLGMDVELMEK
ncbi:MAG: DNA-directed RNA polymerase subunit beta [candidate division Zixibacteria bacterium RBG_16_53_22]|nr:MAG: DNA-directed RNA polymerase subunit beta [candidate division Zixibacteria bacterium RBG_16_53_22]